MKEKNAKIQIFDTPPGDFDFQLEISGCYLTWQAKVLLLKRSANQYAENCWCLPAGKLEKGESSIVGACRELKEETGIHLDVGEIHLLGKMYFRRPSISLDYSFSIYYRKLLQEPQVVLNSEHTEAKWFFMHEVPQVPLIPGGEAVLKYCSEKLVDL